ncbi:MAG TPA: bifunctional phosphopantothenoylcysteine decarboxylase/phosphopantothenate--cysteine ligase CoaBC [Thermoanaerobaculia bacterium]|jgi:phosphopantothenoylcysteine decarboxylase/phosphopantothenate--cysteine ligase|nr:bifunctional phosphopantothenoylcysteine decarboxylase/phosphopantothenate--cysteine ligase CoaBC [Thermoanaerobaculia bacterium]
MNRPPRVLLGVAGGIAAYKAVEVLRDLVGRGAEVRVAMTRGAREFVAPLTFAVLSQHEVFTEVWGSGNSPAVEHVAIADWCDLIVVAPATAHTLGKFANGLADDFLSTALLAYRGTVLLAPAMESAMWENPAVRANLERLTARGARTIGPDSGALASGREGVGRMAEPAAIAAEAWRLLSGRGRDLDGLRVLVTAGPTREPIDPVRFVSNRSSGRMGFALAEAARDRGARVTLAAGPSSLVRPDGVRVLEFETADDLHGLLVREFPECDGLVMAAAVSDFIPEATERRLHRADGVRSVRLDPGRDILAGLAPLKRGQTVVAFAAETEDLAERGRRKMEAKDADLVVVNDVGKPGIGFEAEDNEVLILRRDGASETVSRRSKRAIADRIWDAFLAARSVRAEMGSPARKL